MSVIQRWPRTHLILTVIVVVAIVLAILLLIQSSLNPVGIVVGLAVLILVMIGIGWVVGQGRGSRGAANEAPLPQERDIEEF